MSAPQKRYSSEKRINPDGTAGYYDPGDKIAEFEYGFDSFFKLIDHGEGVSHKQFEEGRQTFLNWCNERRQYEADVLSSDGSSKKETRTRTNDEIFELFVRHLFVLQDKDNPKERLNEYRYNAMKTIWDGNKKLFEADTPPAWVTPPNPPPLPSKEPEKGPQRTGLPTLPSPSSNLMPDYSMYYNPARLEGYAKQFKDKLDKITPEEFLKWHKDAESYMKLEPMPHKRTDEEIFEAAVYDFITIPAKVKVQYFPLFTLNNLKRIWYDKIKEGLEYAKRQEEEASKQPAPAAQSPGESSTPAQPSASSSPSKLPLSSAEQLEALKEPFPQETAPQKDRLRSGQIFMGGAIIGLAVGFVLGIAGGPVGMIAGAAAGLVIGSGIGGYVAYRQYKKTGQAEAAGETAKQTDSNVIDTTARVAKPRATITEKPKLGSEKLYPQLEIHKEAQKTSTGSEQPAPDNKNNKKKPGATTLNKLS